MSRKVAFINLGCRVNRVEADVIAGELEHAGCQIVPQEEADAIIINTCAVTGEAEAKTRKTIRHAARLPQVPHVVATGCVASLFSEEMEAIASNVTVEVDKGRVAQSVLDALGIPAGAVDEHGNLVSTPTPTGRTRPGIKVQDGCDNRCTYCIVWKARGSARSLDPEAAVTAVREAVGRGAREVVLTGINLGSYRWPMEDGSEMRLPELLELILQSTDVERVRLSSIEPPDVNRELLEVMAAHPQRIARFLHICLQAGCDSTLERMARVYDTKSYREVVSLARTYLPDVAIGCDLIVGFPGEKDGDFEQSLAFSREMRFAKMHVFRYSKRPGTPAASAEGQVDPKVMAERGARMRELARDMRREEAARLVGAVDEVVVQYPGRGVTSGLFDVLVDDSIPVDSLVPVRIESVRKDGVLTATVLDASALEDGYHRL